MTGILAHSDARTRVTIELLAGMDICDSLNGKCLPWDHVFEHLAPAGGAVWREIIGASGSGALLEEVLHWGSFEGL